MTGLLTLEFVTEQMKPFGEVALVRKNRIRITTDASRIRGTVPAVQNLLHCDRLITISTADNGTALELIYHLTGPHRTVISLAVSLPRDKPAIASVHDILAPAGIYERQIHDLFGIDFTGHPNLKRIILNEDWPDSEYPLRKDWKPGPGTFYGGISVERI